MPSLDLVRDALRLVGDVRDLPRGSIEQRTHFLDGLARLIGARVAISVRVTGMRTGKLTLGVPVDIGWEGNEREVFAAYLGEQQRAPDPTLPGLARVHRPLFSRTRKQLADDRTWYRSPHVQELRRAAHVDDCILGARLEGDAAEAFSVHRPWGDKPFAEDDARLFEILLEAALPILIPPPALPPRLQSVLDALCRGLSEKQIAAELDLSPHTIHDYVKDLHRRFQAQSRGELLAKALRPGS